METVDYRAKIGDALVALIEGLGPFVETTLAGAAPELGDWTSLLEHKDKQNGRHGLRYSKGDVSLLLRVMTERLGSLGYPFERTLGRRGSNYASELRNVRNRWAHHEAFSQAETYRALDSAELLLALVGADQQAADISTLKGDVMPAAPGTPQTDSERAAVEEPGTGESAGLTPEGAPAEPNGGIEMSVTTSPFLNYAMAHNRIQVVNELRIENSGDEQRGVSVEVEVVTARGQLGDPKILFADLGRQASTTFRDIDLLLDPARMLDVDEQMPGSIRITVRSASGEPLATSQTQVDVLAASQWQSKMRELELELLTSFIQPNSLSVAPLLTEASDRLLGMTGSGDLNGYQSDSPQRVDAIVRSIAEAMTARDIRYAEPPASWQEGQKVRTPAEVLEGRLGTCLDTTLTLAAALEQAGVHATLWLIPGHIFLGYWREEFLELETPVETAPESVVNAVALGHMGVIETTLLTGGASAPPFEVAASTPRQTHLQNVERIAAVVDVALARQRVLPLPSRRFDPDGEITVTTYQPAGAKLPEAYVSTGGGRRRDGEAIPLRVAQWKNALLDLSLRNRLINYTERAGYSLAVPSVSLSRLEDMVNGGAAITLLPSDQIAAIDKARGVRSARDLPELTRDQTLNDKKSVYIETTDASYTSKLRYLANKAKTIAEETGANNLYLAFGMLKWRSGDRDLRSPLVLVPVTLQTPSRGASYRIQVDESGTSTPNYCLLEKLRTQLGLAIPGLENPAEDDSGIDLEAAFAATRAAIREAGLPFLVEETVDLAILQFSKFRLWKDLDENWAQFDTNSLVHHLIETPLSPFVDPVPTRADVDLDALGAACPVPADSSQLDAVAEAVADRTFVLEGPPGTGKSQTITNLLARALAEGKRVLFVAEKRAALEVVKKRLDAVGLGKLSLDLHDKGARPAAVRAQIKQALDLRIASDVAGYQAAAKASAAARGSLARYADRLHEENPVGFSMYSARGEELAGDDTIEPLELPVTFVATAAPEQLERLRDALAALPETADLARPRRDHPWGFLDEAAGGQLDGVEVHRLAAAFDEALEATIRSGIEIDALDRAGTPERLDRFIRVASAPRHDLSTLDALGSDDWLKYIDGLAKQLAEANAALPPVLATVRPAALHLDTSALHAEALAADQAGFFGRKKRRRAVLGKLDGLLTVDAKSIPLKTVSHLTASLAEAQQRSQELRKAIDAVPLGLVAADWAAYDEGALERAAAAVGWVGWLARSLRTDDSDPMSSDLRRHYSSTPSGASVEALSSLAGSMRAFDIGVRSVRGDLYTEWAQQRFLQRWRVTASARSLQTGSVSLERWLAFLRSTEELRAAGLDAARKTLLQGDAPADTAVLAFDRGLAVASISERRDATALIDFDVEAHNKAIGRFTATASLLRAALPTVIPNGVLSQRSFDALNSGGQIGGLRRQLDRQRGGLSVRKLMENYGDVITQIAPCTLISPESVARFFPAQAGMFDIVVFDEASQIRVADAVGAMGRGRSVVVVGDSKQMPPTSFAEASIGGEDDAGESVAAVKDEESILTECVQAQVPSKWLSWHYRSQDESLISFSNHHYYEDRLSSFPAPLTGTASDGSDGHGLSLIRVNGHFERNGKGRALRTNSVEATAIVEDILRRFALSIDETPSVGVVTFNSQQRDLIENLLRDSDDPRVSAALDEPDGLFVKNLENVQGDERDAILFSIAFSANDKGVVPLNFGPLTRAGGERRLNVAITRARRQVVLYSSFDPSELRAHETASIGLKHLKAYLELAQRGVEAEAAGLARQGYVDRHRDEIANELRMRGYAVRTDLGLSDFRVDISIATAQSPEVPLVAVLLDGPSWRLRRTVADRDGLPVEVLGNLMRWPSVQRVWLPEWLQDKEATLDRLEDAVASSTESFDSRPSTTVEPASIEIDELGIDELLEEAWASGEAGSSGQAAAGKSTAEGMALRTASAASVVSAGRRHPLIEDFDEWRPPRLGTVATLDDLPRSDARRRVSAAIADAVEAEGPVSRARLAKLVAGAFGLERVAQSRVQAILRCTPEHLATHGDREFLWPSGITPSEWMSVRETAAGSSRSIEAIPLEEIANAFMVVAEQSAGGEESELKRAAMALFGIRRLTTQIDERLSRGLEFGLKSGRVERAASGLVVSARRG
ncbi:DUF3320 domain-containing protein [Herbiconiux sp. L3-i23]|uniref:DUF3320 domain-containing protein n=1 Tax=Herbiconiux sp. L3-i23 TaxID=2905871 RepID=UPI00206D5815|nr:DUF3320 domain-containing protein [Herbiconiux sp. L3-i23]BDI22554.1 DNA helicase [Herbiconiux sp. L3-i23]